MSKPSEAPPREPTDEPATSGAGQPAATADSHAVQCATAHPGQAGPSRPSSPALDLGIAVALATALIYAGGWAYAYRWFARFDLGIAGFGLPSETFLMYGFWTLRAHWYLLLAYGLGLMLWVWHGARVRLWILRTAPFWLLLAFWAAYLAGSRQADSLFERHQTHGFGCFPEARVGLTPQENRRPEIAALAEDLADRDYRLLLQAPNLLVLIKPKPQGPPVTALVPLGRVDALRLVSTTLDCEL